jgi:hypothetical protein
LLANRERFGSQGWVLFRARQHPHCQQRSSDIVDPESSRRMSDEQSCDGVEALCLHERQELERWPRRPLLAALPFTHKLDRHVEMPRKDTLAYAFVLAQLTSPSLLVLAHLLVIEVPQDGTEPAVTDWPVGENEPFLRHD